MGKVIDAIKKVSPKASPRFMEALARIDADGLFKNYGADHISAMARVLANMHHETGGFRVFEENMNYSAKRLTQVWPRRFPSLAGAQKYANNPMLLANNVYANRMGNGDEASGDGWSYRGGGLLQHTGKAEYAKVKEHTGAEPDQVRNQNNTDILMRAALDYCQRRRVIVAARTEKDEAVTRAINGGLVGHADRVVLTRRYIAALEGARQPEGRTREEVVQGARTTSGIAGGAVVATTGTATLVPPPKPVAQAETNNIVAGVVVVIVAAFIALGVAAWVKARNIQRKLDEEKGAGA